MTKRISHNAGPGPVRRLPQRTCVACRQVKAKRELVRLVRTPGGTVELDATGKTEGRGAYLCLNRDCMEKVMQGNRLEHVLRSRLEPPEKERLMVNIRDILKETGG